MRPSNGFNALTTSFFSSNFANYLWFGVLLRHRFRCYRTRTEGRPPIARVAIAILACPLIFFSLSVLHIARLSCEDFFCGTFHQQCRWRCYIKFSNIKGIKRNVRLIWLYFCHFSKVEDHRLSLLCMLSVILRNEWVNHVCGELSSGRAKPLVTLRISKARNYIDIKLWSWNCFSIFWRSHNYTLRVCSQT